MHTSSFTFNAYFIYILPPHPPIKDISPTPYCHLINAKSSLCTFHIKYWSHTQNTRRIIYADKISKSHQTKYIFERITPKYQKPKTWATGLIFPAWLDHYSQEVSSRVNIQQAPLSWTKKFHPRGKLTLEGPCCAPHMALCSLFSLSCPC